MGNDARHAFVAHNTQASKIVNGAGPPSPTRTGMRPWALSLSPPLNGLLTFLVSVRSALRAAQQFSEINLGEIDLNASAKLSRIWEIQGNFCP